jgi:hypothetical protein
MYGDFQDAHRRGLIPRSLDLIFSRLEEKARQGCAVKLLVYIWMCI